MVHVSLVKISVTVQKVASFLSPHHDYNSVRTHLMIKIFSHLFASFHVKALSHAQAGNAAAKIFSKIGHWNIFVSIYLQIIQEIVSKI